MYLYVIVNVHVDEWHLNLNYVFNGITVKNVCFSVAIYYFNGILLFYLFGCCYNYTLKH